MLVVALTGGIGAGKSTVAQYFAELGALVIDADQLARMAIERGSDGFAEVLLRFGDDVILNGDIDRKKLAEIIFSDQSARKDLETIIHDISIEHDPHWYSGYGGHGSVQITINELTFIMKTHDYETEYDSFEETIDINFFD